MRMQYLRWVGSVYVVVALAAGCAGTRDTIDLELQRDIVVREPSIRGISVDPTGTLDTRDRGYTVELTVDGDPGLAATFDVVGRLRNQALEERSPGRYVGAFQIQQGETGNIQVETVLTHPPSGATRRKSLATDLRLISSPPEPPRAQCTDALQRDLDAALGGSVIRYTSGEFLLNEQSQELLDHVVRLVLDERFADCDVHVHGHADERGSEEFNLRLSRHRALEAAWYLNSLGVAPGRVKVHFHGEKIPVTQGVTSDALATNRRVEFRGVGS